ncbi:hypothetical protein K474DRAFT_1677946 [Panus rudis PR-1116 ss-1]|nr:hypothetical protein K474DRAFT_1677946 [Panus rudis PR-1116 ss-1]
MQHAYNTIIARSRGLQSNAPVECLDLSSLHARSHKDVERDMTRLLEVAVMWERVTLRNVWLSEDNGRCGSSRRRRESLSASIREHEYALEAKLRTECVYYDGEIDEDRCELNTLSEVCESKILAPLATSEGGWLHLDSDDTARDGKRHK